MKGPDEFVQDTRPPTAAITKVLTTYNTRGLPCNHMSLHGSLLSEWLPR
jgi:hypothetical protein